MYKVIKFFMDLQDKKHAYNVGDEYPRKGLEVSAERIAELAGKENKQGVPLIEKVEEAAPVETADETPIEETAVEKAPNKKGGKK